MNFSIGETIGGYEIVGVLGSGGMGEVYRVRNVISDRVDAMKVLLASLQRDQDFATRFLREIKVQARLVHPNIAQLYTAFEHHGNLMMILELVDGQSLLEMLQRGRIPLSSAVDYASQALTALSYAHGQDVIHRDIKPGNIMVTRAGTVKLMDFGIAKATTDRSLTITGNLIGSLYYMSPEQVRAETIDSRSDLYSVGVVLYQMATGRKPFEGDSEYSIMRAQVEQPPPPPSVIDPAVPEELSHIILRALAKPPGERFQTGEEFRAALQQVAALLREAEIGMTRMLDKPRKAAVIAPRPPREAPTAPRERAPERPPGSTGPERGEKPAPAGAAQTGEQPRDDRRATAPQAASVAAEPRSGPTPPPTRSRTPLWIAAGIAAAILVVAGTQLHDWMATDTPARSGTSAAIDLQTPQDQPPARPGPRPQTPAAGTEPESAARSTSATPTDAPGGAPRVSGAAPGPGGTASRPAAREAPRKAATEVPTKSLTASAASQVPPVASPSAPAPTRTAPSAASGSPDKSGQRPAPATRPPAQSPTQAPAASRAANTGVASAPTGSATKTANPPAEQGPSSNPSPPPASPLPAPQPAATDRVYDPAEVDSPPRLMRQVQPRYTEAAQKAAVQGKVRLAAEIWPDGRAHNIRVVESIGHADLDRNAVAALSMWQFTPGRKGGVAVKVRALIDQTYRLQGGRPAPALSKDP